MTTDDDVFNLATSMNSLKVVKHNETDFTSFRDFQQRMDTMYEKMAEQRNATSRRANLAKWDSQLSPPWNTARLDSLNDVEAVSHVKQLIADSGLGSFFIKGEKGTGKTFMALAIARRFIGAGYITPSQVKHISEDDIINIAKSGFKMTDNIEKLLDARTKLFIIDNVGHAEVYDINVNALWSKFFEHVSRKNLQVVFTSQLSATNFVEKLSENAQAKFSYLVNGRIVTMTGVHTPPPLEDEPTPRETVELERDAAENIKLGSFNETKKRRTARQPRR